MVIERQARKQGRCLFFVGGGGMYIYIYGHIPPHDLPRSVSLVNTVKNPLVPYAAFCYSQWLSLDKTDPTRTTGLDAETGETKKTTKTNFLREWGGDVEKDVFSWFCLEKRWFFIDKPTPRKRMVLAWSASGKPSFCEVKVGFWLQNHLLRGKTKKPKKPSFLENREGMLNKMFFFGFAS